MKKTANPQSGNLLFYILIAIVLIGGLMVALRDNGSLTNDVDDENMSVKAGQVIKYGQELSQGIQTILSTTGTSESDVRFAYPSANASYGTITTTPAYQVFSSQGGQAAYRLPPSGVNDGSKWEFYADMALTQVGSSKADLYAYLPNIVSAACDAINRQLGITTKPVITNCPATPTRFAGTYVSSPTAPTYSTTQTTPLPQACVNCSNLASTPNIYYYAIYPR